MIIGIVGDTHGSLCGWERSYEIMKEKGCRLIFHLGDILYHGPRNPIPECYNPKELAEKLSSADIKIEFVKGNCDAEIDYDVIGIREPKKFKMEDIGGFRLFLIHGHDPTINEAIKIAIEEKVDILFHGHTHVLKAERVDHLLVVNPGSPSLPKENNPPSFAILDTKERKVEIISLDGKILREVRF